MVASPLFSLRYNLRMKILITGGAGYIGRWLEPELIRSGHTTRTYDLKNGKDILDQGTFDQEVRWFNPDLIIHLAAKYGRVWGEVDKAETVRENAEASTIVAEVCARYGIKLLYCSSSEVYGDVGPVMYGHDKDLRPRNLYGMTKLWGEQVSELYVPAEDLLITRLNMPAGPGQILGRVGYNALHTFLFLAHRGEEITVHDGTLRSYTWIGDTVEGMRLLIDKGCTGTYNVCNSRDLRSSQEIAELACEVVGKRVPINVVPVPDDITPVKVLDDQPIRDEGWEPRVSLREILERTYEWIRHEND